MKTADLCFVTIGVARSGRAERRRPCRGCIRAIRVHILTINRNAGKRVAAFPRRAEPAAPRNDSPAAKSQRLRKAQKQAKRKRKK